MKQTKKDYQREWRKRNPEYYRLYIKKWNKQNPETVKKYRENCRAYLRQRVRKLHGDAIDMLGGKCIRCDITDKRVLQINHKNGEGTKELKKTGPLNFYKAIIKGKRKIDDLEVRCANCNIIHAWEMREKSYEKNL